MIIYVHFLKYCFHKKSIIMCTYMQTFTPSHLKNLMFWWLPLSLYMRLIYKSPHIQIIHLNESWTHTNPQKNYQHRPQPLFQLLHDHGVWRESDGHVPQWARTTLVLPLTLYLIHTKSVDDEKYLFVYQVKVIGRSVSTFYLSSLHWQSKWI